MTTAELKLKESLRELLDEAQPDGVPFSQWAPITAGRMIDWINEASQPQPVTLTLDVPEDAPVVIQYCTMFEQLLERMLNDKDLHDFDLLTIRNFVKQRMADRIEEWLAERGLNV